METKRLCVENVLCMKGGDGDASHAHNSSFVLRKIVQAIIPILGNAIEENISRSIRDDSDDNVFCIADLGCATGANALLAADTIVKAVKRECIRLSIAEPEFQVCFADLPSNDFNLLFRMLPPYSHGHGDDAAVVNTQQSAEDQQSMLRSRCYFAAAVAESFYKRLFPRKSLNFVHSSIALHWLSKVPESIEDKSSDTWNGGRIFVSKEAVAQAYLRQFTNDLTAFLRCRADEVVPDGCMHLASFCRKSSYILHQDGLGAVADHLEAAFHDLAAEGLIKEEVVDSFNMPFFGASAEEFRSIVEPENSFYVERLKVVTGFPLHPICDVSQGQERLFGKSVANHYRAVFENIVAAHLGSDFLVDQFFCRVEERAATRCKEYLQNQLDLIVAFLVRKF